MLVLATIRYVKPTKLGVRVQNINCPVRQWRWIRIRKSVSAYSFKFIERLDLDQNSCVVRLLHDCFCHVANSDKFAIFSIMTWQFGKLTLYNSMHTIFVFFGAERWLFFHWKLWSKNSFIHLECKYSCWVTIMNHSA